MLKRIKCEGAVHESSLHPNLSHLTFLSASCIFSPLLSNFLFLVFSCPTISFFPTPHTDPSLIMSEEMERTKSSGEDTASVVVVSRPESDTETKEEKPSESMTESKDAGGKDKEEDEKEDEEKKEKIMIGSVTESKDLYAKYDENGDRSWSETPPNGLEEAAENEKTQQYAVLVRKSESHYQRPF